MSGIIDQSVTSIADHCPVASDTPLINEGDFICDQNGDCGEVAYMDEDAYCYEVTYESNGEKYIDRSADGGFISQNSGSIVEFGKGNIISHISLYNEALTRQDSDRGMNYMGGVVDSHSSFKNGPGVNDAPPDGLDRVNPNRPLLEPDEGHHTKGATPSDEKALLPASGVPVRTDMVVVESLTLGMIAYAIVTGLSDALGRAFVIFPSLVNAGQENESSISVL